MSELSFQLNTEVSDYFVGDLHGCYDALMQAMHEVGFDKTKDRLFCTGDLVDRGPDSLKCLELLGEPWFFSVKGNHEAMASMSYVDSGSRQRDWHTANGGEWFFSLPNEKAIHVGWNTWNGFCQKKYVWKKYGKYFYYGAGL